MSHPQSGPRSTSSSSSCDCSADREAFIASLDLGAIQSLALSTRRSQILASTNLDADSSSAAPDLTCTVSFLAQGGSNVLHELRFSDGTHWVIRIPFASGSGSWSTRASQQMHHDIVAQRYIRARTAVPVPRIHAFACTPNPNPDPYPKREEEEKENPLGLPYTICDFVHGTRLVDVWNDPGWWTDGRTRERTLESLARHMVDLARLEFDSIGCLEDPPAGAPPDAPPSVVAFPSLLGDASEPEDAGMEGEEDRGPFTSTHAYLSALLAAVRRRPRTRPHLANHANPNTTQSPPKSPPHNDDPLLAFLALLISALPARAYDRAPFTLCHPDFDAQNVFLDPASGGAVCALVDWDGVAAAPRQLGALTLPMWLTVDWDPFAWAGYRAQAHCGVDDEGELHRLREVYADAVERAAGEVLGGLAQGRGRGRGRAWGEVTRTSHVVSTLEIGIAAELPRLEIVYKLGRYVFGSGRLVFELLEGIEHCAWFNRREGQVPEVVEWNWYKENEKGREEGGSSASGSDDEERADRASLVVGDSAPDTLSPS
ncbi:hypothetical protein C8Q70DRAFT_33410 [Cubamyces menziesii]|nr:hypothetical protein C8Q70DRAFT_33410 [Cubamyces menziesii]